MLILLVLYIVIVIYLSVYLSHQGVFYVFSPFVVIYLSFAISDVVPILMCNSIRALPQNIIYVTTLTTIVNIIMLAIYFKDLRRKVRFHVPLQMKHYNDERKILLVVFLVILFLSGIYTGVTTSIITGVSVESLRRTTEVGLGFITSIPTLGIPLLLIQYFMTTKQNSIVHVGIVCLCIGILLFFTNAARAQILVCAMVFLIWFNLKHRALKWYEYYILFILISPVVATILFIFRSGSGGLSINEILFAHQNMIFTYNTKNIMSYFEGANKFLMGMSYIVPLTSVIPRFLWPDKPMAIDYYYKEITGMDFDGGGIYTTMSMDMYINFGKYFIIFYIIWIVFLHFLYKKVINKNTTYIYRITILYFITMFSAPGNMIQKAEFFILFMIICRFYYGKAKIY